MKMNLLLESSFSWLWSNSLILRVSVTAQGRDTRGWREAGSPFSPEPHITLALALPSQGRRCTRGSELSGSSDAVAGTLWYPGREGFMVQSWGGSLLAQLSRVHIQPGPSFPPMPAQTGFWLRLQHLQFDIFFFIFYFLKCCLQTQRLKTHWQQQETDFQSMSKLEHSKAARVSYF